MNYRFPIGAKFLVLILSTLVVTVLSIVLNATTMFKKDNLNNIYLSSDLLTEAKASEVRFWLDSLLKRSSVIGASLLDKKNQEKRPLEKELLFVNLYKASGSAFKLVNHWSNQGLLSEVGLVGAQASTYRENVPVRFDKVSAGLFEIRSYALPTGHPILLISTPLVKEKNGFFSSVLSIGVRADYILKSFADTGPYTLTLVNDIGQVVIHPDLSLMKNNENLSNLPIVQKMLTSPLEREFQEFNLGNEDYLGAYAKVGLADLGVVSQVEKSIALETGNLLVKRSVLIALAVSSAVFILAYLLVQTIITPVKRLSEAAGKISKGDFTATVQVTSHDEMRDLANSFNAMTSEIGKKIRNLSKINEASQVISGTLEEQNLIEFSADSLMSLLKCTKVSGWFTGPDGTVKVAKNWPKTNPKFLDQLMADASGKDAPFKVREQNADFLIAPIREKSKVAGYLVLSEKMDGKPFQEEDLYMAGTLMSSAGTTFENIRLLKETADKARMEKELETAKHVQNTMFPPAEILMDGLEIQSYYTPAAECGGDWWGCVDLGDGKVLLAMGDATGHGAPAAMITATSKAACSVLQDLCRKSQTLRESPHTIMHFLNKAVYESAQGKILMTFFAGILDTKTGTLLYANASHDPVYWYKTPKNAEINSPGKKENLGILEGEPGPRLGQNPNASYNLYKVTLNPRDFLVLYTDGLPEGRNPTGEEYSDRKFMRSVVKHAHRPTKDARQSILEDFQIFIEGEPLHDDVTLALCRFKG